MKKKGFLGTVALLSMGQLVFAGGNIVLTGHDDDFHQSTQALAQITAMVTFAKANAPTPSKPILVFDHGTELTTALTGQSIAFTRIDPDIGIPAASNFNVANFSAMAVASDSTCGGCDNTTTSIANLTGAATAIQAFLAAGGGIVAFAGATNAATYYGFLPSSASGSGGPPSTGFVQSAFGLSIGVPAVNGDPTHNFFTAPGTGGVSAAYQSVEFLPIPPAADANHSIVTLACQNCTASTLIGATPIPSSILLAMIGLAALGMWFSRSAIFGAIGLR